MTALIMLWNITQSETYTQPACFRMVSKLLHRPGQLSSVITTTLITLY